MPSQRQIASLLASTAFAPQDAPGFEAFTRHHPRDGRRQIIRIFTWSSTRHADDAEGNPERPRAYLCIDPVLDADTGDAEARYRLPLVEWPSAPEDRSPAKDQARRPWADVAAEFREVYLRALDEPFPAGQARLRALPDRYHLG